MEHILNIFDWLLYIWFAINILYLLVYSLASRRRDLPLPPPAKEHKRFAILIPAYREDAVIHECVHSCLEQDYPADCFDTVVISDRMQPETNASLAVLPVRLVEVHFEKSTKSKSLNAAMAAIGNDYDIALVLDADNVIPYDYLSDINDLFANPEVEIVQTHRSAKNLNNDMALLDAISEEINNTIFRLGHAKLGLSAALIGSGMAFRYDLFRDTMADIKAVGGFVFIICPKPLCSMRRYRTPVISPVSAAVGFRHNGITARPSPSFCGRRLLRVTGTSATSFSSSFPFPACC